MRADARANHRDIIVAASQLMRQEGPEVSLRAVANEAGVGVATLYRHFPTRLHLLAAVVEDTEERVRGIAQDFHSGLGTVEQRWQRFTREVANLNLMTVSRTVRAAFLEEDSPHRARMLAVESSVESIMDEAVVAARASGLVGEDVSGLRFLVGLLMVSRPLTPEVEDALPGQQEWLLNLYLRGLRP
ncbi:MAG: helix-turn-helix domain-containing protein [Micrococcus sp.]|nr:helix-turn-helix domain-containing protein [Micrococcus sp.]